MPSASNRPEPAPIIVAYDALRDDRAPVHLGIAAAELARAPLIAASVDSPSLFLGAGYPIIEPSIAEAIESALRRLHDDVGVETRLLTDVSVPHALHRLAEEVDAGLIVVGSTTRGRIGRAMPGSTAERLLHGAPCAVALAPRGFEQGALGTIAVGFIDTVEGRAALASAHLLARRAGARLRVIAGLEAGGPHDAAFTAGRLPDGARDLIGRQRAERAAAVAGAIAELPDGVEIDSEIHVDDPAELLVRVSEHVDLVVCGSRGYGPLRSVLLGGVSRRVVDSASCPVLVLPRGVERPLEELFPGLAPGERAGP